MTAKMLFYFILFMSIFLIMSTNSWLTCWIALEMNLISFIYIITNNKNILVSEIIMKYFIVQTISSLNFLFLIIVMQMNMNIMENSAFIFFINLLMCLKMGAAPLHFWVPMVTKNLNWKDCFILLTIQKISPIIIMSYAMNYFAMMMVAMISAVLGSIGGLNQISFQMLMTFSSINHIAWMLVNLMTNLNLLKIYFLIYMFMSFCIMYSFHFLNINNLYQMYSSKMTMKIKFLLLSNILSLGGLPPMVGFLIKWLTLKTILLYNLYFMMMILIMMSIVTLFYYLQIVYSTMMLANSEKINSYIYMNSMNLNIFNISSIMMITLNFVSFIYAYM